MNPGVKLRVVIFATTIISLAVLIAWTAHNSWQRISDSHETLTKMQSQTFQIADHLQQSILSLNNRILLFAAYRNESDWTKFSAESDDLQHWLNDQKPLLLSDKERPLLVQINVAYQDYLVAAAAIHTKIYPTRQSITRLTEFTDFEKESKHVLSLGFQLATAHQATLESYRDQNIQALDRLRVTLFGALGLLLIAGVFLAAVVYREMISPLQLQLIESRQLADRQEKLASLGMLAAGVAHEIRNPLTAIKAWLYLQQKHLTRGTPEYSDAELIGGEINRLERIVKDFLQFARPSEPQFIVVNAGEPLREVQALLQPQFEKNQIKIVLEEAAPLSIRIDPQQIKQVLINLVQNAADSIGENGTVTLRVRRDEKWLFNRNLEVVILEVRDTGKGISPEAGKRLFDPFFTTKDFGTGLGLPIAARIVEKHHGALQYQTQPDHGTTFGIILPCVKP